jgi:protoporphyrin/coproporphyrin ferrochelatase
VRATKEMCLARGQDASWEPHARTHGGVASAPTETPDIGPFAGSCHYGRQMASTGISKAAEQSADGVLLLAHGTVQSEDELPEFLKAVRRGHPAPAALIEDMRARYSAIGGSPLLRYTEQQARALEEVLQVPCAVAMRLWAPRVEAVLPKLLERGVRRVCLLPLAPFSVDVYTEAASRAASDLRQAHPDLELLSVASWATHPGFIQAQAALIREHWGKDSPLVLTAHSLPQRVIQMGDRYAEEVEACASALRSALAADATLAYQSQGKQGGEWLGPDLLDVLRALAEDGARRVTLAPFGFLADHVETLYDLDREAKAHASQLGMELVRVPALNARADLIAALADLARTCLSGGRTNHP